MKQTLETLSTHSDPLVRLAAKHLQEIHPEDEGVINALLAVVQAISEPDSFPRRSFDVVYTTRIESDNGNDHYIVQLTDAGEWSCECMGFNYRKHCKHLARAYSNRARQAGAAAGMAR